MRIAIPAENGMIFQSFTYSAEFEVFEVEDELVTDRETISTSKSSPDAFAEFLNENKVTVLICGDIGQKSKKSLWDYRIELIPGVKGRIDDAVVKYLSGEVIGDPNYVFFRYEDEISNENKE